MHRISKAASFLTLPLKPHIATTACISCDQVFQPALIHRARGSATRLQPSEVTRLTVSHWS